MAKLTTHILDTSKGTPANGVKINLYRKKGQNSVLIKTAETNSDGRCDEALLSDKEFIVGCYELEFSVDEYFKANSVDCPFLRDVVVRFYITEGDGNYHVPLLISPFSYSTYRGS